MDVTTLRKAGLTDSQAKGYLALIQHVTLSPTQLAEETGESRTNAYAIADKLVEYGLARKNDGPKATYSALHPSALEALAERRRKILVRDEQTVKQNLSPLIDMFYALREEPGARTLQGIDGIKVVFDDVLRTKSDVYLLRTPSDITVLSDTFLKKHQEERQAKGIQVYALTPMSEHAVEGIKSGSDVKNNFHRTFYPNDAYNEAVELQIYGDKVAFIAYGETQMATIITSPPIAEAMRQLHIMLATSYNEYSNKLKQTIK